MRGLKIYVSGGFGFLGKAVCAELSSRDFDYCIHGSGIYDLRLESDVDNMFGEESPDIVIHLAAHTGGIAYHRERPGEMFYDNLMMGMRLLEGSRKAGVKRFVSLGTSCEYPYPPRELPLREDDIWGGYPESDGAPYGIAKRAMITMGNAYRQQYGMSCIHLVPTNLYGPGDRFDGNRAHAIPAMIRKFVDAQKAGDDHVVLWGTGDATRDFLYVEDAAKAIVSAALEYDSDKPINIGSGVEVSIRAIARHIQRIVGYEGRIEWTGSGPVGVSRRSISTSAIKDAIGWRPTHSLDDGLRKTIEWYRRTIDGN